MSARRSITTKLDAIMSTTVRFGFFAVWPVLVAAALGATLFASTHAASLPAMSDNRLQVPERLVALGFFAGSLLAVVLAYLLALRFGDRQRWPSRLDRAGRLHPYLSWILSAPFVVALTEPRIEVQHQWRTWLYISLAVLAWWPTFHAFSARRLQATSRREVLTERQREVLSIAAVFLLWAGYAYFFARLSIINHHAFVTRTIDLGIYDNIFFQSSQGRPLDCTLIRGGNHASAHFDPILVLLSLLYRLWPRAEFLLILQAVWCGAGVVAAYLLGRDRLGTCASGLILALAYALHPALHGANMYEFHSLTLLFSPLLFALYFFLSGKLRLYYAMLALLLLIREDVALLMCFVGFYGVISGSTEYKRAGWATIVACLTYFVLVKTVFMTSLDIFNQGPESYGFSYYYAEMIPNKWGFGDFLITLLTNPAYIVALVTKEAKLHYLLVIFLPTLMLAAWAGKKRFMLLYGLIFTLLASKPPVFSWHFQYSAVLLPVAIALAPEGLLRLRKARPRDPSFTAAVMGCVLVASLLVSWKHGGIVENAGFRGGFSKVTRSMSPEKEAAYQSFTELISKIEPDASVSSSARVGPHVSNRAEVYQVEQDIETDYVLIDTRDLRSGVKERIKRLEEAKKIELVERSRTWALYRATPPPPVE